MSMPYRVTDGRLNLDQQRKRAKDLLRRWRAGDPERLPALDRAPRLADAQWLIAQELGFSSWPRLKAHCDTLRFASEHPGFMADDTPQTRHWRCGNDIQHSLQLAGFKGQFRMLSDPLCMGPVPALAPADYVNVRSAFISHAFNLQLPQARQRLESEYAALQQLQDEQPTVLWCEADAYDQLFLLRALAGLPELPRALSLIAIDRVPGVARFIGIGQLAPELLAWLWPQRRPVTPAMLSLARDAWAAYQAPDPTRWAQLAHTEQPALPLLAPALLRQLQELPSVHDGLALSERLALKVLQHSGPLPFGYVYAQLMEQHDPLPSLGDLMFHALLRPLIDARRPLLHEDDAALPWPRRTLQLTALGEQVLAGQAYGLDCHDEPRWVGGVRLNPGQPHWALDAALQPVWHAAQRQLVVERS